MLDTAISRSDRPERSSRQRARHLFTGMLVLTTAASLASCGGLPGLSKKSSITPTPAAAPSTASVPTGLESFYSQQLDWQDCVPGPNENADKLQGVKCAKAKVPLDYQDPSGPSIELSLKKRAATEKAIGTLFVNPGGPGGSGTGLAVNSKTLFSEALLASYDVVGFDPRGVMDSTAVDCLTDAEQDVVRSGQVVDELKGTEADQPQTLDPASPTALAALQKQKTWLAQRCAQKTTPGLLDHIDTISVARDLDILRAVVGAPSLTYLGYSYGTYLGATYAELFPGNVGRMVLDGAIDPSLSAADVTRGQAAGFEAALRAFVKDCQEGKSCPLKGDVDSGVAQIRQLLESIRTAPLKTADPQRPLTEALASTAIISALYQSEVWSVLSQGLDQAMNQQDGTILEYVSDTVASRNRDGSYTGNGDEAISPINCLDYPVQGDEATWLQQAQELQTISPTFGRYLLFSDASCQAWGHTSTRERKPISAQGAAPVLVVGTTGDPSTPYKWSEAMSSQLASARLLTWEGNGHTAYGRKDAGPCVVNTVDAYLLAGTLPEAGKTCKGQE
ncbi:Tripeptidyl aminopeptidase precursor [Actinomyces bovis]|uniref:Tripeptidyl aminopeptidase n=1 Tax=Actinomyces bovis TaxID=1658 RepID=A0ABY1VQ47_9ACTO|nr:alpha/beta hydrolase [Actinomyces bovis]SPT54259.1 Tripeptidyl aminopeptidase precursor [Actinomyces bovis]VEG56436.1 Tripeptidyl aminopeptidase precursor [Actinomyces israelii]